MPENEETIAWLATETGCPVIDNAGEAIGKVDAVLGDEASGIFHGYAVNLKGMAGTVELPAEKVERITTEKIYTSLTQSEIETLEKFEAEGWFDFEGLGRLLKRATGDKNP